MNTALKDPSVEPAMIKRQMEKPGYHNLRPQKITAPELIANLLLRIHHSKVMVTVTIPGIDEPSLSTILDIKPDQGYLLLDELKPEEAHKVLVSRGKFRLHAMLKGVELSFIGVIDDVDQTSVISLYKVPLPGVIYYFQRRASFRAHVSMARAIPISLGRKFVAEEISGRLNDISVGGIGARISARRSRSIKKGELMPSCAIRLPAGTIISSSLEVRFIDRARQERLFRLGGSFVDLDPQQRKIIEHFVAELDREMLRKMPKE